MRKVIVNHNGQCGEHRYEAGVPVELPEEVIVALGDNATPIEPNVQQTNEEPKVEKEEPETEKKEIQEQDVEDKMIKKAEVITK